MTRLLMDTTLGDPGYGQRYLLNAVHERTVAITVATNNAT